MYIQNERESSVADDIFIDTKVCLSKHPVYNELGKRLVVDVGSLPTFVR